MPQSAATGGVLSAPFARRPVRAGSGGAGPSATAIFFGQGCSGLGGCRSSCCVLCAVTRHALFAARNGAMSIRGIPIKTTFYLRSSCFLKHWFDRCTSGVGSGGVTGARHMLGCCASVAAVFSLAMLRACRPRPGTGARAEQLRPPTAVLAENTSARAWSAHQDCRQRPPHGLCARLGCPAQAGHGTLVRHAEQGLGSMPPRGAVCRLRTR